MQLSTDVFLSLFQVQNKMEWTAPLWTNRTTASCKVNRKSLSELNWFCENIFARELQSFVRERKYLCKRTQKFCERTQISLQENAKVLWENANISARERKSFARERSFSSFAIERQTFVRERKYLCERTQNIWKIFFPLTPIFFPPQCH